DPGGPARELPRPLGHGYGTGLRAFRRERSSLAAPRRRLSGPARRCARRPPRRPTERRRRWKILPLDRRLDRAGDADLFELDVVESAGHGRHWAGLDLRPRGLRLLRGYLQ